MGCYIWYSEEGPGRAAAPSSPLLAVPNVTAHPSTASVPITVLLYDGPLLCGFNVAIKGLTRDVPESYFPIWPEPDLAGFMNLNLAAAGVWAEAGYGENLSKLCHTLFYRCHHNAKCN